MASPHGYWAARTNTYENRRGTKSTPDVRSTIFRNYSAGNGLGAENERKRKLRPGTSRLSNQTADVSHVTANKHVKRQRGAKGAVVRGAASASSEFSASPPTKEAAGVMASEVVKGAEKTKTARSTGGVHIGCFPRVRKNILMSFFR